jgi:hypothetical protein
MGAESFSDVSDADSREMLLGFVDQLRMGKPAAVILTVMKSRLPNQPQLWNRVIKAGSSGQITAALSNSRRAPPPTRT